MSDLIVCSVPGCSKPSRARGWCHLHYKRWQIHGAVGDAAPRETVKEKMIRWKDSRDRSTCWEADWSAATSTGYPFIREKGRTRIASQVMLELCGEYGGHKEEVLHSCDNCRCVNPDHLRWGSRSENIREKYERTPPRKRTTVPCEVCGKLHRDHGSHLRSARWNRRKKAERDGY